MITVTTPVMTIANTETGIEPYLVDLPGWFDSTEVKLDLVRRTAGNGVYGQSPIYDDARFFSIVGRMINPGNATAVFELRTQVMAHKNLGNEWPITVGDPKGTRTAMVKVAGKILFDISNEDAVVDFAIPLMAKDSRTYGPVEVVSTGLPSGGGGIVFPIIFPIDFGAAGVNGRVVTTNLGEAETYSTVEVTGGLTGGFSAVCVELGQEIRFERTIPVGSTVLVNLRTGQAFIDGQSPVSGSLTRREWWTNPPGELRTIQFNSIGAVTGTPTLTARTAPAYN